MRGAAWAKYLTSDMPELPEVETIAQKLRYGNPDSPSILGHNITGVELFWDRTLASPTIPEFFARLPGQGVMGTGRRAKFLIIRLSVDHLVMHLRMSGDIYVEPEHHPMRAHDRLILHLDGGLKISFNDTRKFGRVWLMSDPSSLFAGLGPEPLDNALTPEIFHKLLKARRRQLKPLLLDQTFLAGVGNIYSDEALHLARLHPLALSDTLNMDDAARLLESIRQVLALGIKEGGATIDWVYRGGGFQNHFRVYGRGGKICPACGSQIERIIVGQRSTHYCPVCQGQEM